MAYTVQEETVANQPLLEASAWKDAKSSYESHENSTVYGRSDYNRRWLLYGLMVLYAPLVILCVIFYTKWVAQSQVVCTNPDLFPCKSELE